MVFMPGMMATVFSARNTRKVRSALRLPRSAKPIVSAFNGFFRWKGHEDAVDENGENDEKAKERMHQHVDGNAADRVEGVQYPERFGGAEAKNEWQSTRVGTLVEEHVAEEDQLRAWRQVRWAPAGGRPLSCVFLANASLDALKGLASERPETVLRLWHRVMVVMVVVRLCCPALGVVEAKTGGSSLGATGGGGRATAQCRLRRLCHRHLHCSTVGTIGCPGGGGG
ncbi:hypothetical protein TYRP_017789 [Tyrophagus putrescentiae]|nr:hypothetical protein TYRP_017789 [Tyrophagus putrescentiae]